MAALLPYLTQAFIVVEQVLVHMPWDDITPLALEVVAGNATRKDLETALPGILDAAFPFDEMIPGPLGVLLEKNDANLFAAVVHILAGIALSRAKHSVTSETVAATPRVRSFTKLASSATIARR